MKLSVWAKRQGISYKTAWRLFAGGKLPLPAEQLERLSLKNLKQPMKRNPLVQFFMLGFHHQTKNKI